MRRILKRRVPRFTAIDTMTPVCLFSRRNQSILPTLPERNPAEQERIFTAALHALSQAIVPNREQQLQNALANFDIRYCPPDLRRFYAGLQDDGKEKIYEFILGCIDHKGRFPTVTEARRYRDSMMTEEHSFSPMNPAAGG